MYIFYSVRNALQPMSESGTRDTLAASRMIICRAVYYIWWLVRKWHLIWGYWGGNRRRRFNFGRRSLAHAQSSKYLQANIIPALSLQRSLPVVTLFSGKFVAFEYPKATDTENMSTRSDVAFMQASTTRFKACRLLKCFKINISI